MEKRLAELVIEFRAEFFIAGSKAQGFDGFDGKLAVQTQRAFDDDFPIAESFVGEDFGLFSLFKGEVGVADALDVFRREFAVFLAEILAEGLEPLSSVDELNLAFAVFGLAVGEHPDVSGDAGVIEKVEREGDDGFDPIVFNEPAADVAFALASVAGEER